MEGQDKIFVGIRNGAVFLQIEFGSGMGGCAYEWEPEFARGLGNALLEASNEVEKVRNACKN